MKFIHPILFQSDPFQSTNATFFFQWWIDALDIPLLFQLKYISSKTRIAIYQNLNLLFFNHHFYWEGVKKLQKNNLSKYSENIV